jgi:tetratricopeptide (TPR) repeat protein
MDRYDLYYRASTLINEVFSDNPYSPNSAPDPEINSRARVDPKLAEADEAIRKSIDLCQRDRAYRDLAFARRKLGEIHWRKGEINAAENEFRQAKSIIDSIPELSRDELSEEGVLSFYLGQVARIRGDKETAVSLFERSYRIDSFLGDQKGEEASRKALKFIDPNHLWWAYQEPDEDMKSRKTEFINQVIERRIQELGERSAKRNSMSKWMSEPKTESEKHDGGSTKKTSFNRPFVAVFGSDKEIIETVSQGIRKEVFLKPAPRSLFMSYCCGERDSSNKVPTRPEVGVYDFSDSSPESIFAALKECNVAILIFNRTQFVSEIFRRWVAEMACKSQGRDDFKIFVRISESDKTWLELLSESKDAAAVEICENVHLKSGVSLNEFVNQIACYADDFANQKSRVKTLRRIDLKTKALGLVGKILIFSSFLFAFVIWAEVLLLNSPGKHMAGWMLNAAAWVSGITTFVVLTPFYFAFGRSFSKLFTTKAKTRFRPSFQVLGRYSSSYMFIFTTVWILWGITAKKLELTPIWINLGLASGIFLEMWRRSRFDLFQVGGVLEKSSGYDRSLRCIDYAQGESQSPFVCPLFWTPRNEVFISYAHDEWGEQMATRLTHAFENDGMKVFRDNEHLAIGGNWRRQLLHGIRECGFFVSVIDRSYVTRHWTTAEAERALQLTGRTGCPKIVLLLREGFSLQETENANPVFRLLLGWPETQGFGGVRHVRECKETPEIFAEALKKNRSGWNVSIFPKSLTVNFNKIRRVVAPMNQILFNLGPIALISLFWSPIQPLGELIDTSAVANLVSGFFVGYGLRELSDLLCVFRHAEARENARIGSVERSKFFWTLSIWFSWLAITVLESSDVSSIVLGWVAFALVAGCYMKDPQRIGHSMRPHKTRQ